MSWSEDSIHAEDPTQQLFQTWINQYWEKTELPATKLEKPSKNNK